MTLKFRLVSYIMFMFTLPTFKKKNYIYIYLYLHIYNLQYTSTYDFPSFSTLMFLNKNQFAIPFSNIVVFYHWNFQCDQINGET